jgi:hypothetical protein
MLPGHDCHPDRNRGASEIAEAELPCRCRVSLVDYSFTLKGGIEAMTNAASEQLVKMHELVIYRLRRRDDGGFPRPDKEMSGEQPRR